MAEFIRFIRGGSLVEAIANAQADLERGYSFRCYQFFESREDAEDSDFVQFYGVDADTITEIDGQFAFALPGLCGYEDDERDLSDYAYSETYNFVARFQGRYIERADADDGDVFRPSRLIGVDAIAAVAVAA